MCSADACLTAAGMHPGISITGFSGDTNGTTTAPATPIPVHCHIPAPCWERPVGKAMHCRPADIRLSVCEDWLAEAGPVSGLEMGASARHSAAPAPTSSFCPLTICIPGGRLGPLLLGAASWHRVAAEAAPGSSPPAVNGTFVGDAGSSSGLARTHSGSAAALGPGAGGLCPPAMSSPSQASLGWDLGGCSPGLAIPICCWGGLLVC